MTEEYFLTQDSTLISITILGLSIPGSKSYEGVLSTHPELLV